MNIRQYALTLFTLCCITGIVNAQKQPQIQEGSIYAPANVKIDGKLNEWQNPFINVNKYTGFLSAFNSACRIYYTVANDDKNLYLVVRGLGNGVSKKILAGGLTFTVSHTTDRNRTKDRNNAAITFPMPQGPKTTSFIMSTINQIEDFTDDTVAHRRSIDSLDAIANRMANTAAKEIRISGIKDIQDSVISIYNTEGIKASIQFMQEQAVIEIAVPLKYLGLSVDNPAIFSYNIRIDAVPPTSRINGANDPNMPVAMNTNPNNGYAWNPTDFWGEYILAKK
jgi:hypothetical protein